MKKSAECICGASVQSIDHLIRASNGTRKEKEKEEQRSGRDVYGNGIYSGWDFGNGLNCGKNGGMFKQV